MPNIWHTVIIENWRRQYIIVQYTDANTKKQHVQFWQNTDMFSRNIYTIYGLVFHIPSH